ncbi:virR protein [Vibrio ishigakensis]|uniref:VirR protein n=1 Tax=Vibrio ishigakensis TaxID=1481914 RepID=A0A0B8P426_9VIBR|nr:virR protein [Vibrio ishigakensis]
MTDSLTFIGKITTPYQDLNQCPNNIQFDGPSCTITVFEGFAQGLKGLSAGEHILILYWLTDSKRDHNLQQGKGGKGTFALRSPHRPNPIGAAVLPITKIENGVITVKGLDCLDGTPLLDIKPAIYREHS